MILSTTARHRHFQDWTVLVLPITLPVMEGLHENKGTSNSVRQKIGPDVQRWEEKKFLCRLSAAISKTFFSSLQN